MYMTPFIDELDKILRDMRNATLAGEPVYTKDVTQVEFTHYSEEGVKACCMLDDKEGFTIIIRSKQPGSIREAAALTGAIEEINKRLINTYADAAAWMLDYGQSGGVNNGA